MAQTGLEPAHATLYSLEDTELNHQTIWTVAQSWLLCLIDKDVFAYNLIMKVKLKILEHLNLSFLMLYLLVFEFCLQHVLKLSLNYITL